MFVFTQGVQENTDPSDHENDGENADNLKQKKYQDCININTVTVSELKTNPSLICFKGPKRGTHSKTSAGRIKLQENHPVERDPKSLSCVFSFKVAASHVDI